MVRSLATSQTGLWTAVYFDGKIELEDARRLFHDLILKIAGLPQTGKA